MSLEKNLKYDLKVTDRTVLLADVVAKLGIDELLKIFKEIVNDAITPSDIIKIEVDKKLNNIITLIVKTNSAIIDELSLSDEEDFKLYGRSVTSDISINLSRKLKDTVGNELLLEFNNGKEYNDTQKEKLISLLIPTAYKFLPNKKVHEIKFLF